MPIVDFRDAGLSGPSLFYGASQEPLSFPGVNLAGGTILSDATNSSADEGIIYGTASPDITGGLFPSDLLLTFSSNIINVTFNLINGESIPETYTISDETGLTQTVTIPANTQSGDDLVTFPTTGYNIKISSDDQSEWDFFIDNIQYNVSTAQRTNVSAAKSPTALHVTVETAISDVFSYLGIFFAPATIGLSSIAYAGETFIQYQNYELLQALLDPYDPNYKTEYVPANPSISFGSLASLPTALAQLASTTASLGEIAGEYINAIYVTLNRLNSATQADDTASINLQNTALGQYVSLSSQELTSYANSMTALANAIVADNLDISGNQSGLSDFITSLKDNGESALPSSEISAFHALGLSDSDIASIISNMTSVDVTSDPITLASALTAESADIQLIASDYTSNNISALDNILAAINGLYENILGRPADPGGLATFETVLAQPGASLATIQANLAASPEAAADINTIYLNVLGRPADPVGLATWQAELAQSGQSLATLQAAIASSPEAAGDINTLYQNVLGRPADPGGLAAFQTSLTQPGTSLATIQADLAASAEAAADVNTLYQNILGRPADPSGLAAFQTALAQPGASLATIQADLANSPEGTAVAAINTLYQNVLGRPADPGGLASFEQVLTQPGGSLSAVRSDLINSAEAQQDIEAIYNQFDASAPAGIHAADKIEGTIQLNAGLSLADLRYQIDFIDGNKTIENIPTNTTLTALSTPELFQTQLTAVGQSVINNFNPSSGIISVNETFSYASIINGGQQTAAGFQINLGSGNSILLSGVNQSSLVPHDFRFV